MDAAIVQAVGRGVNRTADNPLDVWVLGNVITPWPVTDLARWTAVAPSPVQRMAARGAVLLSPVDAHACFGDLFVTPKAAEHAFRRADFPPTPYVKVLIKDWGRNR